MASVRTDCFGAKIADEAVEIGLTLVVVVRVALALDGLADLVVGELEGTRPHDVLLVPVHVLVELLLGVDVGVGVGQRRQEREGGEFQLEHHRLVVRRRDAVYHHEVVLARAGDALGRKHDLVPARGDVLRGQRRAVVKLDALADLERVGQPVVRRLGHLRAQVAHEIRGRGRVARIDADQHAVERSRRVHHGEGRLAVPIVARPGIGRDHVRQDATALRRLRRCGRSTESNDGSQHRLEAETTPHRRQRTPHDGSEPEPRILVRPNVLAGHRLLPSANAAHRLSLCSLSCEVCLAWAAENAKPGLAPR